MKHFVSRGSNYGDWVGENSHNIRVLKTSNLRNQIMNNFVESKYLSTISTPLRNQVKFKTGSGGNDTDNVLN